MAKILKFKNSLKHYLMLIDKRKKAGDLWGVLEAGKSAMENARTKNERGELNLLLAESFFEMKQFEQSAFYYFKCMKNPNLKAVSFFGIGKNLAEQKQFSLALDYFEKSLDFDIFGIFSNAVLSWTEKIKNDLSSLTYQKESMQNKAQMLIFEKNFSGAKQILYSLESDEKTLSLLSICALFEHDLFSAKKFADKVLVKNSDNITAKTILFEVYKQSGKTASMQKIENDLTKINSNDPHDLRVLGMFFSRQQKFSIAKKFFESLLKVDEFNPKNHLFCALVCQNLGDTQNAIFHLLNAKWLDFENPIYDFFLTAFKDGYSPFEIKKSLPKEIEKQKLDALFEIFLGGKFCECVKTSHTLLLDAKWSFSLNVFDVSNIASQALCFCKHKKSQDLIESLLLSKMPAKQKFVITKNALLSNNFPKICLVSNYRYSSFCITKNELQNLGKLKKGTAKAISYCECFFGEEALIQEIFKQAKQNKENQFLIGQKSSTVACFLLKTWPKIFFNACIFFQVNKLDVENIEKSNKLVGENLEQNKLF